MAGEILAKYVGFFSQIIYNNHKWVWSNWSSPGNLNENLDKQF